MKRRVKTYNCLLKLHKNITVVTREREWAVRISSNGNFLMPSLRDGLAFYRRR